MGQWISNLVQSLFSRGKQTRIVMLGLNNAGKTTMLYKLKLNKTVSTTPTVGFNVETVTPADGVTFTIWDVGGPARIRTMWRHYCDNSDGIVYVVDSTDINHIEEAREELFGLLQCEELRDIPIVVLANKQDIPGAMTASEVSQHLCLNKLAGRNWCVQQTSATSGEGLYEAMKQLATLTQEFIDSKR